MSGLPFYVAVTAFYPGAAAWNLKNLEAQDDRDFTVIVIDPGWDDFLPAALARTPLRVLRVPYKIPPGARNFDWGAWNSAFLVPESDNARVLRLQSWRMLPRNGVALLKSVLPANVGLIRNDRELTEERCEHYSGYRHGGNFFASSALSGHNGDWCIRVGDFVRVNGIDECLTMLWHFEDVDFGARWANALAAGLMQPGVVATDLLLSLTQAQRQERGGHYFHERLPRPCPRCTACWEPLRFRNDQGWKLEDLPDHGEAADLGVQFGKRWLYCDRCGAFCPQVGHPHCAAYHGTLGGEFRAPTGLLGRAGRDLGRARTKARALPVEDRLRYVAESYWDDDVLFDGAPYRARTMFEATRWALLEEILESAAPRGAFLEIGACQCGVCAYLAARHPARPVVAFDRFERGLSELGPRDMPESPSYHEGVQASSYEENRLWACSGRPNLRLVPGDVRRTLAAEPDYPVALAVIDLNLYEPTLAALRWVWPRLPPDGWVLCDDVDFPGVRAALDDFGVPYQQRVYMAVLHKMEA